jgi:hypothetical protein
MCNDHKLQWSNGSEQRPLLGNCNNGHVHDNRKTVATMVTFTTTEKLLGALFSVQSMQRLYRASSLSRVVVEDWLVGWSVSQSVSQPAFSLGLCWHVLQWFVICVKHQGCWSCCSWGMGRVGIQRKGNVHYWKPLPINSSEDVTMGTSARDCVCVCVCNGNLKCIQAINVTIWKL